MSEPTDRPRPAPDASPTPSATPSADEPLADVFRDRPAPAPTPAPTPDPLTEPPPAPSPSPKPTPGPKPTPSPTPAATRPAARPAGGPVTRVELQPAQAVAAAGSAIVSAARMGRLLGRTGWRLARQLPGAHTVEREAQRLQAVAVSEARRLLQLPQTIPGAVSRATTPEEQRVVDYLRNADPGAAPLRSAMSELLERSVEATRTDSRDYLYGTIISQLVPDEARILSALSDGAHFAALDVVQKLRRGRTRTVLAHASAVGRQAGLVSPDNTPTYLTRLHGFGLVEFGPEEPELNVQYDILATDPTVQDARKRTRGNVKLVRSSLLMSEFGAQFWRASDPSRPALPPS